MYVDFFGLRELPFNNTPDPRFFFSTPDHEEALASLIYAVQARKGFVLLTGEVGAGKTLVSRLMLRRIGSNIAFANINHAVQSARDLMEAVCNEFEMKVATDATHAQLVRTLHDFLLMRFAQNIPVVLVLDEAQNLPNDAFEQLRMIGNLEADDAKLLQICIVGQPELQARFAAPELRQLRQRLFRSFHLPALDRTCTEGYMRHRITVSGGTIETIFSTGAIDEVFRLSRGLPRLINTICDNAMLSAYAADQRLIDEEFVRTVTAQMMLIEPVDNQSRDANTVSAENAAAMPASMNRSPNCAEPQASACATPRSPMIGISTNRLLKKSTRPVWHRHLAGENTGWEPVPHMVQQIAKATSAIGPREYPEPKPPPAVPIDATAVLKQIRSNRAAAAPIATPASLRARSPISRPAENVTSVVRNELGRLRSDIAKLMGQTSRRMGAIEKRLTARDAAQDYSRRSSAAVSPILIRAAAIIERAEHANRTLESSDGMARSSYGAAKSNDGTARTRLTADAYRTTDCVLQRLDWGDPMRKAVEPLEGATGGLPASAGARPAANLGSDPPAVLWPDRRQDYVTPPSTEDIDAVVKRLDDDARTADSMLRAWQRSEANSKVSASGGDRGNVVARLERVVQSTTAPG